MSHETIYKSLFVQARGALRKELAACLRTGRTQRCSHKRTEHSGTGRLREMVMISERPPEAADRAIPGHWEGDLLMGKGGRSAIGTLVERSSRYVMLVHLPNGRTAEEVRQALTRQVQRLPAELRRTLTWDQGKEMAHAKFRWPRTSGSSSATLTARGSGGATRTQTGSCGSTSRGTATSLASPAPSWPPSLAS